jgi:hypothetical protein
MKTFKVRVLQSGFARSIDVIAKSSIDALLIVCRTLNENEPSVVIARLA